MQARARSMAAERVAPAASAIDADAVVPAALGAGDLLSDQSGPVEIAIVAEELAAASAAVALILALPRAGVTIEGVGTDEQRAGLRGVPAIDAQLSSLPTPAAARAQVVLASTAVGIGRAAVDQALGVMRAAGDRPGGNPDERPHWMLSDAATEIEGARLLTLKAAEAVAAGAGHADARLAKVFAAEAADRAVAAALRIVGADGARRGSVIERLARDARALAMLGGTPDVDRAIVADETLPT